MHKLAGFRKLLMGSVCVLGLVVSTQSEAQVATYYDNNVMVDLSVLDDGGVGATRPASRMASPSGKLPPLTMPKSQFFGLPSSAAQPQAAAPSLNLPQAQPQSRIVLKKPSMSAPQVAKQTAPKLTKPMMPKPTQMPKSEMVKSAPKAMVKKAEVKKPALPTAVMSEVKKPAPAPAPKPVMETVKAPPPAPAPSKPVAKIDLPKPIEKKQATPSAVLAEAPPPPPTSIVEPKKVVSAMKKDTPKPVPTTSTAALPPMKDGFVRIDFDEGQSNMPKTAQTNLEQLIKALKARPNDRVQLLGYAGGEEMSPSKARRLSLSRALAVRSYLTKEGKIPSTRIDVRAQGNKTTEEPFDRVDVQITSR